MTRDGDLEASDVCCWQSSSENARPSWTLPLNKSAPALKDSFSVQGFLVKLCSVFTQRRIPVNVFPLTLNNPK